jgi:predicted ATPase
VFFDRGYLDGLAYCHYFEVEPPAELLAADGQRYDRVFVLDTLTEFLTRSDEGRTSDKDRSIALGNELEQTYRKHGYRPIRVAVAPVTDRVDAILEAIAAS